MMTVDAIMLPGQHSVVLGRMPKKGRRGPALEKLSAPALEKLSAPLGQEGGCRQSHKKQGRGSVRPPLWDIHLLLVPHALWTSDADVGSLGIKRAASPECTRPVAAQEERNPAAEPLPYCAAWASWSLARWLEKLWLLQWYKWET